LSKIFYFAEAYALDFISFFLKAASGIWRSVKFQNKPTFIWYFYFHINATPARHGVDEKKSIKLIENKESG